MATKQLSELRNLPCSQLFKINKDDIIDSILASGEENDELAKINKRFDEVMNEMQTLKNMITSPDSQINKNYTELKSRVDKQAEIISKQQHFLEVLDRKEREANVVILGVPEEHEALDGAVTDQEKINKICSKIGVDGVVGTHRRLGVGGGALSGGAVLPRRRPILLTLADRNQRICILDNANRLKGSGDNYSRIYIKKDVHPSVRKEWRRLRDAETAERARPENVGCDIRLDTRERKLYKDLVVIDSWNPQFF